MIEFYIKSFNLNNTFIIYLVYQKQTKDSIELPKGSVIKKINDSIINSYQQLIKITNIESIEFISGHKYFL